MLCTGLRESRGFAFALVIAISGVITAILSVDNEFVVPIMLALLLIPLTICSIYYAVQRTIAGDKLLNALAGLVLIFIYCANFRFREYEEKSLDFQVVLKLLALGLFIAFGARPLWRACRIRSQLEILLWCLTLAALVGSAAYAPNPAYSAVSAVGLVGCFAFTLYLVRVQGADTALQTVYLAALLLCTVSLFLYFTIPSFARMYDWQGEYFVETTRLSGVFTSANGAGSASALGLVLASVLRRRRGKRSWDVPAALIMTSTLFLTNNKGAVFALVVGIGSIYAIERRSAFRLALFGAAAAVFVIILSVDGEALFALISRSGSSEEVLSATGRNRIWAVVVDMWSHNPIFGYGWGSSLTILPTHPALFRAAASAHNLYLEILFSSGMVGLFFFVVALVMTLRHVFVRAAAPYLGLFTCILVYACSENIFGFPSFMSLVFFLNVNVVLSKSVHAQPFFEVWRPASPLAQ